jgi:ABC-type antimicrobial peptide transport system permease subunit
MPGIRDRGHGLNDVVDYWASVNVQRAARPGFRTMEAVAKLKPGVTLAQAQGEMDSIARQLEQSFPDTNRGWTVRVVPISDELLSDVRPVLFVLMGAAAFVLLIACGNVAVLMTFNAVRRFHETAVRAALGAVKSGLDRRFRLLIMSPDPIPRMSSRCQQHLEVSVTRAQSSPPKLGSQHT